MCYACFRILYTNILRGILCEANRFDRRKDTLSDDLDRGSVIKVLSLSFASSRSEAKTPTTDRNSA